METQLGIVILAAGKGTRMHSDNPKVLQPMLGEPMLRYVLDALSPLGGQNVWTVIGHGAASVEACFPESGTRFVVQERQLGTGHALQTAWPEIVRSGVSHVLVVNGDTPLIATDAMRSFVDAALRDASDLAFITLTLEDTGAFGRVVRKNGEVAAIIEARDYSETEHGPCPREINSGIYFLRCDAITPLLPKLQNANKSGEFYITDLVGLAVAQGLRVSGVNAGNDLQLLGVNTPGELVAAEELLRARLVQKALDAGALIFMPALVRLGPDAVVEPGAMLTGPSELYRKSRIARGARVASHCYLEDTAVLEGAVVHSFCHFVGARVGENCIAGPFARMRPGAVMEEGAHLGSYVEIKKSRLGKGAKANHLAYIGDADVGAGANIGAGVITCNYDGKNKHATHIGAGAFVGSNAALVAPVRIGDNAFIGAGSVITKNVPDETLGVSRVRQNNLPWKKK
ncbi:Bifunctional protein GlmU (Includes: UDP-N-acetylglucosamine pyrophosphorylase; Glucosamine-1-phosphate N-acetyltransferase) [uncultured delta proteobacterium]|uniref:Bifunctional protein GlmU n=1 Tax=uncultured delta proteobacterium TaxID=34034 RepID=A0A212J568_9DELT|nr:Bifunctional protein GlmU (Includes: UDP-N-acetylglucosamine pyrophosphorylase; Glucosamine-1-phosphate N-acetyltransferase) [uncultured delta proteobacterium]